MPVNKQKKEFYLALVVSPAEDRLPNAGVRSQLPQFWKNLRVQILKCKAPKDMAAAAIKFAGQIKDNVLLEDWESKVLNPTISPLLASKRLIQDKVQD
jgi:hypothetical protein